MNVTELRDQDLDYEMYLHACKVSGKQASKQDFEEKYSQGQYHFHRDKALLLDLIETYKINVQHLAQEWLASTPSASAWGETPLVAVCRLVLSLK